MNLSGGITIKTSKLYPLLIIVIFTFVSCVPENKVTKDDEVETESEEKVPHEEEEDDSSLTEDCPGVSYRYCIIENGQGSSTRKCTDNAWSEWGECKASRCYIGFKVDGDKCVKQEPDKCNGLSYASCVVPNGIGQLFRTCTLGQWSNWGVCENIICNQGYQLSSGQCEEMTCTGNRAQDCSIANGNGQQLRTCSLGQWSSWGVCENIICNQGYQLSSGQCEEMTCTGNSTQDCSIANGNGQQLRTCSLGQWSSWGVCEDITCNLGYQLSGGQCVLINNSCQNTVSQVTFGWDPHDNDCNCLEGFNIYFGDLANAPFRKVASVGPDETSFTLLESDIDNSDCFDLDKANYFYLTAYSLTTESSSSNVVCLGNLCQ